MKFYLGTHMPNWLEQSDVPWFVSRRRLFQRKTLPQPLGSWALDSGGFTELNKPPHRYTFSVDEYVADVRRFEREMPGLEWVAPMDWMCEPFVLTHTGLTVKEHQLRTIENFRELRSELGPLVIPVLQGWERDDYLYCESLYAYAGFDLATEPLVGVGSVCRRQSTHEAAAIFRALEGLNLHGFGLKKDGLYAYGDCLVSADSMAWSSRGRRSRLKGCTHASCANCLRFALRWRDQLLERLGQQRLELA